MTWDKNFQRILKKCWNFEKVCKRRRKLPKARKDKENSAWYRGANFESHSSKVGQASVQQSPLGHSGCCWQVVLTKSHLCCKNLTCDPKVVFPGLFEGVR